MILFLAILFLPHEGFAFELTETSTGSELRWDPPSFSYGANFTVGDPNEERFAAACRSSADRWMLASSLGFEARWSGPHQTAIEDDGANTIDIVDRWNEAYGESATTVAHTEVLYAVDTGEIREGDILLNGASFTFDENGFDVESVVLHEFGHLIGIAHSCGDPGRTYPSCFSVPEAERMRVLEAVMAPTLAPGVERRLLSADDLDALAVHYAGSASGSPPSISLSRVCPEGTLVETPTLATTLRFSTAEVTPLAEEGWEGAADLIVRDPNSGLFSVLYLVEPPPRCGVEPDPAGCGCRAHRQSAGNGAMLWLALAVAMALRGRWWLWTMAAASVLLAGDALAFKCSRVGAGFGPSLIWLTRTIPWYADEALFDIFGDRIAAEEDARQAFKTWEDVACSDVTLPLAAIIPGLRAEYLEGGDNKNVVVALSTGWPHDRTALAVTTNAYDVRTGVVVDTDMEINAERFVFQRVIVETCVPDDQTMDLRNTITHEVGHIVGLDHPPNTSTYEEVTMFASAPPCEIKKRSLESDDIDGICSIYPSGAPTQQCFPPEGPTFAEIDSDDGFGCSTTGQSGSAWLVSLAVILTLRRRRGATDDR